MVKPNKLRSLRRAFGFTQQDLATRADISTATITAIERYGYVPKRRGVREKIAKVFDLEESEIFREAEG